MQSRRPYGLCPPFSDADTFQWALSAVLDLASEVSNETRVRILQPLRSAEAKFAKKRTAASPAEERDPTAEETDEAPLEAVAQTQG